MWTALLVLVLSGIGSWLIYCVLQAVRTGTATVRGGYRVHRRNQPIFYWFAVVVQASLGFSFSAFAIGLLMRY
jgi:uncharacterized membrane-anchored protein